MEDSEMLVLTWNNHSSALVHNLGRLHYKENFCDATLVCEDKHIPVHKIVLSCCSEFFEDIFIRTPCRHPFIVLKDIPLIDLEALLDYMYKGRVSIFQSRLSNLMKASDSLKIKGLSVSEDNLSQVIVSPKEKSSFQKVAKRKSNTLLVEEGESACSTSRKKRLTSPGHFQTNKTKLNPDDKNKNKSSNETMNNGNDDMLSNMGDPVVVLERHLSLSEDQLYIVKDKNEEEFEVKAEKSFYESSESETLQDEDEFNKNIDNSSLQPFDEDITGTKENEDPVSDTAEHSLAKPHSSDSSTLLDSNFLKCSMCPFQTKQTSSLVSHVRKHSIKKPFKCGIICQFRACTKMALVRHARSHSAERPFKCTRCHHRYKFKSQLDKHEKTHSNEKQFVCAFCTHQTSTKSLLSHHVTTNHE